MQITKFPARLSQHKRVLWDIQGCRRSFRFTSVLGTPAFALKEIFKIIHHFNCLSEALRFWQEINTGNGNETALL